MKIPSYCTQNDGDCLSCNLSGSDGVDCQGNDFFICLDDYPEPQAVTDKESVGLPADCTHDGDCDICEGGYGCRGNLVLNNEPEFPCLLDLLEEPDHPEYCTQNGGDCSTCSLVNYGLDCQNNRVSDREVSHG